MVYIIYTLSLIFALDATNPNKDCISAPMYYNYHSVDMLTVKDSTIREMGILRTRFPKDIDSAIFDVKEMVDLDYKQLDALYSFVKNGSSNIISNNNATGIEKYNCLWLVYGYRDRNNHLNALVKVINDDSLHLGKHSMFDPDYPKFFLQTNYWKYDWNNGTVNFFLILDLENGCEYNVLPRLNNKSYNKFSDFTMPTIVFLDEPSISYPEPFSSSSIFAFRQSQSDIERLTNEYCFNNKRIYQLNDRDLEQLKLRIYQSENNKTKKALQKVKLFGLAYIDSYGRIDVKLFTSIESSSSASRYLRNKLLVYKDLYQTLPQCH